MNDTTFFNTILIIIIGNMNSTFIGINIQIFNAKIFNNNAENIQVLINHEITYNYKHYSPRKTKIFNQRNNTNYLFK